MEENQLTPLMVACQNVDFDEIKRLIDEEQVNVDEVDSNYRSAIFYCIEHPMNNCIDLLIKANANLNIKDIDGYTCLQLAVICGNIGIAEILCENGADVNSVDNEKHTLLHWSVVCGHYDLVDYLLKNGCNPEIGDNYGAYPIHYAAQMCGQVDVWDESIKRDPKRSVKILKKLIAFKVNIEVEDFDLRNPMIWAASSGSVEALSELFNAGGNPNKHEIDGLTPLHCAASRGHVDCMEMLINKCRCPVDVMDNNNCSPLFYAVTLGQVEATELLIKNGSNLFAQDNKGRTVYHCAAARGQMKCLQLLCKYSTDVWLRNDLGDFPIQEAYYNKHIDIVCYLINAFKHKEAIKSSNANDGRRLIHLAAADDNVDFCVFLLNNGAEANCLMKTSTSAYLSPYDVAKARNSVKCMELLQNYGGRKGKTIAERSAKTIQRNFKKCKGDKTPQNNSQTTSRNSINSNEHNNSVFDSNGKKNNESTKKPQNNANKLNNNTTTTTTTTQIPKSKQKPVNNKQIQEKQNSNKSIINNNNPNNNKSKNDMKTLHNKSAQTIICSTTHKLILVSSSSENSFTSSSTMIDYNNNHNHNNSHNNKYYYSQNEQNYTTPTPTTNKHKNLNALNSNKNDIEKLNDEINEKNIKSKYNKKLLVKDENTDNNELLLSTPFHHNHHSPRHRHHKCHSHCKNCLKKQHRSLSSNSSCEMNHKSRHKIVKEVYYSYSDSELSHTGSTRSCSTCVADEIDVDGYRYEKKLYKENKLKKTRSSKNVYKNNSNDYESTTNSTIRHLNPIKTNRAIFSHSNHNLSDIKSNNESKRLTGSNDNDSNENDHIVKLVIKSESLDNNLWPSHTNSGTNGKSYASLFDRQRLLLKSLYEIRRSRLNNRNIVINSDLNNLLIKNYNFDIQKNCRSLKDLEKLLELLASEISEEFRKYHKKTYNNTARIVKPNASSTITTTNVTKTSTADRKVLNPIVKSKSFQIVKNNDEQSKYLETEYLRKKRELQNLQLKIAYRPILPDDIYKQYYKTTKQPSFKDHSPRDKIIYLPVIRHK